MPIPRLRLSAIKKNFGQTEVIKNLFLEINGGEVLALLGDNGAGKSTLIKIIAGFHKPCRGEIFWEGSPLSMRTFSPEQARALGIQTVYQHLGLVNQLSIARNFFLGAEPKKGRWPFQWLDRELMHDVVAEKLKLMGLKRKLDPSDSVEKLSGGERQAIAIARARYFGAKLLILDEPTSALSVGQTEAVLDYIKEAASSGIAVIFITHTLHHIERIVDQVVVLHQGQSVGNFAAGSVTLQQCSDLIMHGRMLRT